MLLDNTYTELIVKFSGDIIGIINSLGGFAEILECNYAIVTIPVNQVNNLYNYKEVEYFEPSKNVTPNGTLKTEMGTTEILPIKSTEKNLNGKGVIVGIIDSGIDYIHKDFINNDGTSRIIYIWDQSIDGNNPKGFIHGSEYTSNDINKAIKESEPYSILPSQDLIGHGTAVTGIAAGNSGIASQSLIISVKLGSNKVAKTTDILRGIKYIIDKSIELNMPASINISYGMNDGSHTGNSLFEQSIASMCNKWKISISVAMGNEGSAGHHFSAVIKADQTIEADFAYQSFSKNLYIDIWKSFNDNIEFELVSPNRASSGTLYAKDEMKLIRFGSMYIIMNYKPISHYNRMQEIVFTFSNESDGFIPGIWKLIIKCTYAVDQKIDIWLPTIAEVGTSTAFLNPDNLLTLTLPSTVERVISVGGYNSAIGSLAYFSGMGNENISKPDLVAPAVNIYSSKVGGDYDSFSGTSMASPFVCGSAALMMEWGIVKGNMPFLYGESLKAYLIKGADRSNKRKCPDFGWGYGVLDLKNTFILLE